MAHQGRILKRNGVNYRVPGKGLIASTEGAPGSRFRSKLRRMSRRGRITGRQWHTPAAGSAPPGHRLLLDHGRHDRYRAPPARAPRQAAAQLAVRRPAHSADQSAQVACQYHLDLPAIERQRNTGALSGNFWLQVTGAQGPWRQPA